MLPKEEHIKFQQMSLSLLQSKTTKTVLVHTDDSNVSISYIIVDLYKGQVTDRAV